MKQTNLSMLCDFYEFTMSNGYQQAGFANTTAYFDLFFRSIPDHGGYAVASGLQQVIEYIDDLHFSEEDIAFLRLKKLFSDEFLSYLSAFRFSGDIYAVPEGTPIFPNEPLIIVRAPIMEAQLLETYLLMAINHQSLIATKASRIVRAAQGRPVLEFGSRRAHGADAAILGARAAYIGGCSGTSCTLTDQIYDVPAGGTMAHAWVQMFDSEYEAFKTYCTTYPNNATLLVDTYNTLSSGVPNAIRAIKEILVPQGFTQYAIRIDSGDICHLSKQARKMMNDAGLNNCKIVVSNALDEYLIRDLLLQGAEIDVFGVGERLITSKSSPVFDGVYKLAAVESTDGIITPKIKISDHAAKTTNPHFKKLFRLFDKESGIAIADQICLSSEHIVSDKPLPFFEPDNICKIKEISNFFAQELLVPVFRNGVKVYDSPPIDQIRKFCENQIDLLPDEVKRFEAPQTYGVVLSEKLLTVKNELLRRYGAS